jgi:hypothetical protein
VYQVKDLMAQTKDQSGLKTVEGSKLSRPRHTVSKQLIKTFFKEYLTRESFYGAPWVVKDEIAKEYDINTQPPPELWDPVAKKMKRPSDIKGYRRRKKREVSSELAKPKFPIEDSELPIYMPNVHPEMATDAVPVPNKEFMIPKSCVGLMVSVYSFLFSFAQPLQLAPFTIDDFEASLCHADIPTPPILDHIHCSLLHLAAKYNKELNQKLQKLAKTLPKHKFNSITKQTQIRSLHDINDSNVMDIDESGIDDEASNDEESTESNTAELLISEENWYDLELNSSSWPEVLLSFLISNATGLFMPNLAPILKKYTGRNVTIDPKTGKPLVTGEDDDDPEDPAIAYIELSVADKLEILEFLINETCFVSKSFRKYIEESISEITDLKRERREVDNKKKSLSDAQKALEKKDEKNSSKSEQSSTTEVNGAAPDDNSEAGSEVEGADEEESEDESADEQEIELEKRITEIEGRLNELEEKDIRGSRQEKVKLQQELRDAEDELRSYELKKARDQARERTAELRAKAQERRQLDSDLSKIHQQELHIDREIRTRSGAFRVKPIGYDRFWNKYWWVDGYGSGLNGTYEYGVTARASTLLPYATGRLWIEGRGQQPYLGLVSGASKMMSSKRKVVEEHDIPGWKQDPFVTLPHGHGSHKPGEAIGKNWLDDGEWACYDNPDQIDELLCWLNPKGIREQQLKSVLLKYYDHITCAIKKRQQLLENRMNGIDETRKRSSSRLKSQAASNEPHMTYKNKWKIV